MTKEVRWQTSNNAKKGNGGNTKTAMFLNGFGMAAVRHRISNRNR